MPHDGGRQKQRSEDGDHQVHGAGLEGCCAHHLLLVVVLPVEDKDNSARCMIVRMKMLVNEEVALTHGLNAIETCMGSLFMAMVGDLCSLTAKQSV